MPQKKFISLCSLLLATCFDSTTVIAVEAHSAKNLIWISHNQNQFNYNEDTNSQISPNTTSLGYGRQLNDRWQISFSRSEMHGSKGWLEDNDFFDNLFNQAQVDASGFSLGLSYLINTAQITLTYSQQQNDEASATFSPRNFLKLAQDVESMSLNYANGFDFSDNNSSNLNSWQFDWAIGLQYNDSRLVWQQMTITTVTTLFEAQVQQSSWNSSLDLSLSHWSFGDSFNWSPLFNLNWTASISSNDELQVVGRIGDLPFRTTRANDRVTNSFRTPDTGYVDIGLMFDWQNDFSSSISIGQSVSADIKTSSLMVDLSYIF